jgi:signal transduction histidine kinase
LTEPRGPLVPASELEPLLEALQAAARGEHGVRIPAVGSGMGAKLAQAFNELAETRERTTDELVRVGAAIGREGRLTARAQLREAEGTWKQQLEAVNHILEDRDLTEDRALERLRSDLVATVSHELRTPLAAIYGAAVTVRRDDVTVQGETRDRLLEIIETESSRLAEIVSQLLLASHLDSGQLQLAIETVNPKSLTQSVISAAQTHLPDGVSIEFRPSRDVPPVRADEQQLRQVLVNLVENAVKYSPDGGPVTIELKRASDHVLWAVHDEGLGIPARERRRVFEKFYRLDPHMTRGIGGTGLGLYICRELVTRLDGKIWVEANNGRGSSFFVSIPVARTPTVRTSASAVSV